jgi:hypothetical protein
MKLRLGNIILHHDAWLKGLHNLTCIVDQALPRAWDFDIDPNELKQYFEQVEQLFQG